MYINDRRRRVMRKKRRGLMGFGDASDCGADQVWCADYVYAGLPPGQCVTKAQCDAYHQQHPQQQTNIAADITSIAGALSSIFGTQQQTPPPAVVSTGPSTMTIVAIGGAALLGVYLLTR